MAMTPSEKKYHELRKENKVLKKEITELTLQVKFLTERLELKNEQLFDFRTATINKSVDEFIKFKHDLIERKTNA